jgi:flagellar biosynthesis protein FlhB
VSSEEKTEPATEQKIRQAVEKGNRVRSPFVGNAISTVAIGLVLATVGPFVLRTTTQSAATLFSNLNTSKDMATVWTLQMLVTPIGLLIAGIAGVSLVSFGANILFNHGHFAPAAEAIKPDINKVNPMSALKKMFSAKTWYELVRNLLFISISFVVVSVLVFSHARDLYSSFSAQGAFVGSLLGKITLLAVAMLFLLSLVFALIDRTMMKFFWMKELKMAKSEVKRENIQNDGDPRFKQHRRGVAQEAAQARDRFDISNVNFAIIDPSAKRLLGFCHAPDQLERPVTLLRVAGPDYNELCRLLSDAGVTTIHSAEAIEQLFPRARLLDYVPKQTKEYLESLIAKAQ